MSPREFTPGPCSAATAAPSQYVSPWLFSGRREDQFEAARGYLAGRAGLQQLEVDKAEMKEQLQFLTTGLKMLKEQRKAP